MPLLTIVRYCPQKRLMPGNPRSHYFQISGTFQHILLISSRGGPLYLAYIAAVKNFQWICTRQNLRVIKSWVLDQLSILLKLRNLLRGENWSLFKFSIYSKFYLIFQLSSKLTRGWLYSSVINWILFRVLIEVSWL